jgi:hypothetical protein
MLRQVWIFSVVALFLFANHAIGFSQTNQAQPAAGGGTACCTLPKAPAKPDTMLLVEDLPECVDAATFAGSYAPVLPEAKSIKEVGPHRVVLTVEGQDAKASTENKVKPLIEDLKKSCTSVYPYPKQLPGCVNPATFASDFGAAFPDVKGVKATGGDRVIFLLNAPLDEHGVVSEPKNAEAWVDHLVQALKGSCSDVRVKTFLYFPKKCRRATEQSVCAPLPDAELQKISKAVPGVLTAMQGGDGSFLFTISMVPDPGSGESMRDLAKTEAMIEGMVNAAVVPAEESFAVPLPRGTANAEAISSVLNNKVRGATVAAVGPSRLLVTPLAADNSDPGHERLRDSIADLVKHLAVPAAGEPASVVPGVSHLFYFRDNAALATALNNVLPWVTASALGPDGISLAAAAAETGADEDGISRAALKEAKRIIAQIDQPRPQLSLNVWSLQQSSMQNNNLNKRSARNRDEDLRFQKVQSIVAQFNESVSRSVNNGWGYLRVRVNDPGVLDPAFAGYLASAVTFVKVGEEPIPHALAKPELVPAGAGNAAYGLGFEQLFTRLTPNLMNMLLALLATRNPWENANCMINRMEGEPGCAPPQLGDSSGNCQQADQSGYNSPVPRLRLECTRALLKTLFTASEDGESNPALGKFRALVADFLFQYKLMIEYSGEFDPYMEPYAASQLDAELVSVVDAFETDLTALNYYVRGEMGKVLSGGGKNDESYDYSGIVSIKVLASNQALVQTSARNYFPATPPSTLADYATALGNAESSQPAILKSNLPADAVTASLAALAKATPPKQTVSIGREFDLTVTPYTLSGANGAELDIDVTSKDNGASIFTAGTATATSSDDLASRVDNHHVKTHVRLQSLRLFEVSSLDSMLARGKTPWKPFDPYLEIPVLGELVRITRHPDLIRQRSTVFLSAVIIPTAADLASTPFEEDVSGSSPMHRLGAPLLAKVWKYHSAMLDCFANTVTDVKGATSGCPGASTVVY